MTCQSTEMFLTLSTSPIQREVAQANGQTGSNQKSTLSVAGTVLVDTVDSLFRGIA